MLGDKNIQPTLNKEPDDLKNIIFIYTFIFE